MTKRQFYWRWHVEIGLVILAVFLTILAVWLYSLGRETQRTRNDIAREAERGAQAHVALCAQRVDLQQRLGDSRTFLRLTVDQRVAKFGGAIGHIPPGTIRAQIVNYERTLDAYKGLKC